jgi:hypothetical protein
MRDDEKHKETGTETPCEPAEEPKKLDRGTFLKALGVGIGAVGLDMVAGIQASARTAPELETGRIGIQRLMRGILESPGKAEAFVDNPVDVAQEYGVHISEDDAKKIRETLMKLTVQAGDRLALTPGHQDWAHQDGNWHDSYNKTVDKRIPKGTKGDAIAPVTPKPPTTKPPGDKRR